MNDRFKFRIFSKNINGYIIGTMLVGNGGKTIYDVAYDCCNTNQGDYIIEQCTGLKDKNGNLIYEGDILDCELQDIDSHGYPFIHFKKGVVKRAKNGAYCVEGDDDFYASDITLYPIEIKGNIHEQAEQKD